MDGLEAQLQSKCCFPSRSPLRVTLQARNSDIAMPNQQPEANGPSVCPSPGPLDCSSLVLEHSEITAIFLARRSPLQCHLLRAGGYLWDAGHVLLFGLGGDYTGVCRLHQAIHLWLAHLLCACYTSTKTFLDKISYLLRKVFPGHPMLPRFSVSC